MGEFCEGKAVSRSLVNRSTKKIKETARSHYVDVEAMHYYSAVNLLSVQQTSRKNVSRCTVPSE